VEVLEKMKEVLGEGHPDTLTSMGNLAFTLRAMGRCQPALTLLSSCVEMSQAKLGIDHPDTIARRSWKASWEAEDREDDTLDDVWVDTSDGTEEEEEDNDECNEEDEDDDEEATGEETDKVADPPSTESANGNLLDSTVDINRWNQPQFLWML